MCDSAFFTVAGDAHRHAQQLMAHAQEVLADDVELAPGSRWWMSATRPATEFSMGIMA